MKEQVLPILRSTYEDLTKSEKKIADYISEHRHEIMGQTVAELAQGSGSSEITISRFCKKLGFSGLQSLKIALAAQEKVPAATLAGMMMKPPWRGKSFAISPRGCRIP